MTFQLELSESDDILGQLYAQMPVGILLVAPDLSPIGCNPAFARYLGYEASDMPRLRLEELIIPEDVEAARAVIGRLRAGDAAPPALALGWRHRDGQVVGREVQAVPFRRPDGSVEVAAFFVLGATADERADDGSAARQKFLSALHDRLISVIAEAPVAVAMFDCDMRYVTCSRRWVAEYAPHQGDLDLTGQSHLEVIPDQPQDWLEVYRRALGGEVVSQSEYRFQRADGAVMWLNWVAQPLRTGGGDVAGILIFTEDVTARRQLQASLSDSQERLSVAQTAGGFGAFEVDLTTRLIWWSDEALAAAGLMRNQVPESFDDWAELASLEDGERLRQWRATACDPAGDGRSSVEVRIDAADGLRWLQLIGRAQFEGMGAGRRAVRIVGVVVDQTQPRQMQAALAKAQRVESVGRLAGVVAHDFNNLLCVIQANLDLAEIEAGDGPLRAALVRAREGTEMGASFVRRLLPLMGNQEPRPQVVSPVARLVEAGHLLSRALGELVTVRLDAAMGTWPVLIDPGELDGSVLNLAINARDALMPRGGEIVISTANATLSAAAARRIPGGRAGDFVRMSVTDAGVGMTAELAKRAIEPFFTTKLPGQGTGLGLTSVAAGAERAGGFMEIASRAGEGTTVTMWLPRHAGAEVGRKRDDDKVKVPKGDGELILVVEDDALVREAALKRLDVLGYAVIEATDAATALRLLEAGEPVELLFTDVVMPGAMSGHDLAADVRQRWPGMAILLTSGYAADWDSAAPDIDLLPKPYGLPALAQSVHRALTARPHPVSARQ